ncbi:MAG: FtsX-like permease family protein, partial [Clostridium sp.]
QQFLIEAVFLSLLGGIIGLIFGSLIAYLVCYIIGSEFLMSISTIILAFGFSVVIGIVFGLAPARKASKLNPIDALRSV